MEPVESPQRQATIVAAPDPVSCSVCAGPDELLVINPLERRPRPRCLGCAGLDHLSFLPSADGILSRLARRASRQTYVVEQHNPVLRNRRYGYGYARTGIGYERQGILAEQRALEVAAGQCLADPEALASRRARDRRWATSDDIGFEDFAAAIRAQYPGCPPRRAEAIAYCAAARGRGLLSRNAAANTLDPETVDLVVATSVRHVDTEYDRLRLAAVERAEARTRVAGRVFSILDAWRDGVVALDE